MGTSISNKFLITAIDDGMTVQGNLRSTKTLVQAYDAATGGVAPDWTVASNQPTIYAVIMKGSTLMSTSALQSYKWLLNGQEIADGDERFEKTTYVLDSVSVPALKIVENLASADNLDIDLITLEGTVEVTGSPIAFAMGVEVRITEATGNGYLGVVSFDGPCDITEDNDEVEMTASLFSAMNELTEFDCKWYVGSETSARGTGKTFTVGAADVTDYAVVKCEFYKGGDLVATAFVGVDDTTDPQYMYVTSDNSNGSSAVIRSSQGAITFKFWVATLSDATNYDESYETFKVYLYDVEGTNLKADASGHAFASDGTNSYVECTPTDHVASITLTYADVAGEDYGKGSLTGIIVAS